jgi:hypothetical protein
MRTPIIVTFDGRWRANVRGPGSWDLCRQAGRRKPHWSRVSRSWVVNSRTAADVIALAEHVGMRVVVTGDPSRTQGTTDEVARPDRDTQTGAGLLIEETLW